MRAASRGPTAPRTDGVITSLTVRRGRSDRIAVNLDGALAFELAAVVADEAGLRVGGLLTAETQERLVREDEPYRARSRALRLLALRDRSRREVERRLVAWGFDQEVVANTTAWLDGLGYLDDDRFATRYVTEKRKAGWGDRRLRGELLQKGVERALVAEALSAEGSDSEAAGGGADAALTLARKRFGQQFASDPEAAERRAAAFLARRGYDWETIARLLRELRSEAGVGEGVP
jgi:regulatory protein